MADEEIPKPAPLEEITAPGWIVTYGDMMSLLLTFFILLVAFSTQDVAKFKALAGSMKDAFGVQKDFPGFDNPMGDSLILPFFESELVNQVLVEELQKVALGESSGGPNEKDKLKPGTQDQVIKETAPEPARFDNAIENVGLLDLIKYIESTSTQNRFILRIPSKFLFGDGSAELKSDGLDILQLLFNRFKKHSGEIIVEAHTDNIQPGAESIFKNNWELSTAQAVSIVKYLINKGIKPDNISAAGHSDTKPIMPNDTPIQRERNKRIEFLVFPKPREVVFPVKDGIEKKLRLGPKGFIETFYPSVKEEKEKEDIRKELLKGIEPSNRGS